MRTYAARIENDTVTQVIVGSASWAAENLGGEWVHLAHKAGAGWLLVDGEIVPPPAPEIDPDALI